MSNVSILILAAGDSRRFQAAGYATPKPLLQIEYGGATRSMLSHVWHRARQVSRDVRLVKRNDMNAPEDYTGLVFSVSKTIGQADTLRRALDPLNKEKPVLVLDCDMLLNPIDMNYLANVVSFYDVAVAVTKTFDPNASTVDDIPFPTVFREKECASSWGIVGARAFRNVGVLMRALDQEIEECVYLGREPYVTPAINRIDGEKYAHLVGSFVDWGTPERLTESGAKIV